jgi:prolipoprotein diacylglyceryltransferase
MKKANHIWDHLARTGIRSGSHRLPAFQVCGYGGLLLAIVLAACVVGRTGLSYQVMGAIVLSAMATFLALVLATKIVTGEERIVYYHHEIAVMLAAAVVARLLHRPVLPYLDVTILGVGAFLACGRVGCLMVGCCHGRPSAWGICYREEHAREGFASYLVGVRLFPIQAVETLWVLFVVALGALFVWQGRPPGTVLAWYTIAYGGARFGFEFARGGADRPYTCGFSQAQWLSFWLMVALVAAEISGRMVFVAWHAAVAVSVMLVMLAAAVHRKLDRAQRFRWLHPYHVREIAEALLVAESGDARRTVVVASTSMGLKISTAAIDSEKAPVRQYALSRQGRRLDRETADVLADLVMRLRHRMGSFELLPGAHGVFHLLVREGAQREFARQ